MNGKGSTQARQDAGPRVFLRRIARSDQAEIIRLAGLSASLRGAIAGQININNIVRGQFQSGNQASVQLVRRLGFRKEGYSPDFLRIDGAWKDHERWAITSEML